MLEIGLTTWAAMLLLGCALIRTWARRDERRARLWRIRRRTEILLRYGVAESLGPDPNVSRNALRTLDEHWRHHADVMKPDDEDFLEAVAAFIVMFGSGDVVRDRRRWPARWTIPEHKALAARLAVDIAARRRRQPNTIAQWIVGLPTDVPDRTPVSLRLEEARIASGRAALAKIRARRRTRARVGALAIPRG